MNVKIAEDSVTFKITQEELQALFNGRALEQKTRIGQVTFTIIIEPDSNEQFNHCTSSSMKLILNHMESRLVLYVKIEEIHQLWNMGKSRDGISAQADGLNLALQVDIRKDSRPRVNS